MSTEATAYKPVPVVAALAIAENFDKDIVVIFCVDRACDKSHTTTYGKSAEDKLLAAQFADRIAKALDLSGPPEKFEDFRHVDAAKRAQAIIEATRIIEGLVATAHQRHWAHLDAADCACKDCSVKRARAFLEKQPS